MTYSVRLADLLSVFAIENGGEQTVSGLALDSRKVKPGYVFFACKGTEVDGRQYIDAAISAGAIAVVYEAEGVDVSLNLTVPSFAVFGLNSMVGYAASAFYKEPSGDLQVFGVTGTNGKTTCCYLLVQAFKAMGMKAGMIGTIGVGDVDGLVKSGLTTPDPISLQKSLAEMRDLGFTQVAIEVSSHALDQGRVNGINFFCTLFTNLSHDHLDYHGDMETYWQAKQRLFSDFQSELVVANAADQYGCRIIDIANSEFIIQYGSGGDVFADEIELERSGISMTIEGNGVDFDIDTPLIGEINVPNIEMLVATLLALSLPIDEIQSILTTLRPAPGRMELYGKTNSPSVVVDYAHTPDALEKALKSVRSHCVGRLWCVFGCGGDRDKAKRPLMGAAASKLADFLIVTNDNPRGECPESIANEIMLGVSNHSQSQTILDRACAIEYAIQHAKPDDLILIAGKGHESTQTIRDQVLTFSDREFVKALMVQSQSPTVGGVE